MEFLNNLMSSLRFELGSLIYKIQGKNDPRVVSDVDLKIFKEEESPLKNASANLKDDQYVVMEAVKQGSSGNIKDFNDDNSLTQ